MDILKEWKQKNGFQFSDRSLYRYIDELANNLTIKGETIEVYYNENNKKTWKLIFDKSKKDFTLFDINTFYLTKHFVPQSIIEHRKESFDKIEKLIYEQQSKDKFEYTVDANNLAFRSTNFYDITYSKEQQRQIEDLIWAIQNKQKIRIQKLNIDLGVYHNGFAVGNLIYPIAFMYHRGVLHLCTFNETTNHIAIIPFDTLVEFSVTNKHFNPKKYETLIQQFFNTHFGITENINNKIYTIELEFSDKTGLFVKQFFWHSSQQFTSLKNGNILLKLKCGINRELVGWLFQWMSNVRVRKPEILKEMLVDKYKDCINIYEKENELTYNNSFVILR